MSAASRREQIAPTYAVATFRQPGCATLARTSRLVRSVCGRIYEGKTTKRLLVVAITAVAIALVPSVVSADGFTLDTLDDNGWLCGPVEAGLPPGHCVNPGTGNGPGETVNVMVFDGSGHFRSAETVTTHPLAADRPCPHDAESPDGTWWNPGGPTPPELRVCHHQ